MGDKLPGELGCSRVHGQCQLRVEMDGVETSKPIVVVRTLGIRSALNSCICDYKMFDYIQLGRKVLAPAYIM